MKSDKVISVGEPKILSNLGSPLKKKRKELKFHF